MSAADQNSLSRRATTLIKTIATITFVAFGAVYVARRLPEFAAVDWPSSKAIFVVAFGFVASVFFRSLYNYFVTRQLGTELSLFESFMLSAVVTASNAILPANPGASFRAVYMKKVHAFAYGHFASSAALYLVITTLIISFIGMALLLMINYQLNYFRLDLFIALPVISLVMSAGLLVRQKNATSEQQSIWASFRNSYLTLIKDKSLIRLCTLIVSSNFVIAALVWLFVLAEYSPGITAIESFLFAASQIVSGLINLTPGAAGFQELVGIYVGRSFELTAVELFAILVWVRLVRVLMAILVGIPSAIALHYRAT